MRKVNNIRTFTGFRQMETLGGYKKRKAGRDENGDPILCIECGANQLMDHDPVCSYSDSDQSMFLQQDMPELFEDEKIYSDDSYSNSDSDRDDLHCVVCGIGIEEGSLHEHLHLEARRGYSGPKLRNKVLRPGEAVVFDKIEEEWPPDAVRLRSLEVRLDHVEKVLVSQNEVNSSNLTFAANLVKDINTLYKLIRQLEFSERLRQQYDK